MFNRCPVDKSFEICQNYLHKKMQNIHGLIFCGYQDTEIELIIVKTDN